MKVLFTGRKPKNEVLLQAFGVVMRAMNDDTLNVYCAGDFKLNDQVRGYANILENSFKGRGKHIHYQLYKTANPGDFDMVVWFAHPNAKKPAVVKEAQDQDIEVVIFRH